MKKFQVHFKDGTDIYVDAESVRRIDGTGPYQFYESKGVADFDVWLKTDEVLYIVAVPGSDSGETDSK